MSNAPRAQKISRNWGDDDTKCDILHVDMDSFYAQVEIAENPHYAGKPLIVGHDAPRSVVTAATYDLKNLGIYAGMPIQQAKRIAPHAIISVSPRQTYLQYSQQVMQTLNQITPAVEQISIDEAFLNISGSRLRLGTALEIAQQIRTQIRNKTGLPASVGIAANKSVAKIASAHAKPDGILLIPYNRTKEFLRQLPVGAIWGVGGKTQTILAKNGIETVAQLADMPTQRLSKLIGKTHAYTLQQLANGIDLSQVGETEVEKSISTENTFSTDVKNPEQIHKTIVEYAYDCARRLRAKKWLCWTISIKIRAADFTTVTRSRTLRRPTDLGAEIAVVAQELFDSYGIPVGGVRLLGVKVESLQSRDDGVVSFLDDSDSRINAERMMDAVSHKYGADAIKPASLLKE